MGFIDDKQSFINEIGIFKTINDLPDSKKTSSFNDVRSASRNILPFLLQTLSTACEDGERNQQPTNPQRPTQIFSGPPPKGTLLKATGNNKVRCNVLRILIEILVEFLPELIRIMKEAVVVAIRESLSCSSDFKIPPNTSTIIDIETIDYNNLLKTNPDANILGGIFFGSPDRDFNRFLNNLLDTPNVTETWEGPNGPLLDITYLEPDQYIFSVNPNYWDVSYNDFISDYMASIELFNKKILLGTVIDYFFSNITSKLDFSLEQLVNEEKTNKLMDKIMDEDPCYDEVVYDDSFFSFSNSDIESFERKARERKEGIVSIDLGCGIFAYDLSTSPSDGVVKGLLDELETTNDPAVEENNITNIISNIGENVSQLSPPNTESIKNKIHFDFVLELPKILMKTSLLTPKILGIYSFSNYIVNNTTTTERNSFDFAKANRVFFEYVLRESLAVLVRIIFNRLKAELLRLISKVISRILKSIINKKLKIITSFSLSIVSGFANSIVSGIPSPSVEGSKYK
jgi:hypothetical protein